MIGFVDVAPPQSQCFRLPRIVALHAAAADGSVFAAPGW